MLRALREGGPQRVDQLAAQLTSTGRRPLRPGTVAVALGELRAAGLASVDGNHDGSVSCWSALPVTRDPLMDAVDLHGAHDLRHTFATWLEDAGIPARVIDELMGHEATGRTGQHQASAMGAHYRHTTPEMAGRVIGAVQQRLTIVLQWPSRPWSTAQIGRGSTYSKTAAESARRTAGQPAKSLFYLMPAAERSRRPWREPVPGGAVPAASGALPR